MRRVEQTTIELDEADVLRMLEKELGDELNEAEITFRFVAESSTTRSLEQLSYLRVEWRR